MQTIVTAINKGGTGKTATAAALAQAAVADGKKVLAVDMDPQANLTLCLAADPHKPGAYHLLEEGKAAADLLQDSPQGMKVIAGSPNLMDITTGRASALRLQKALAAVSDLFDICIIDTPPAIGELTFNALQAADALIVPVETDSNALQGLYQITDIAARMQENGAGLRFMAAVITRYDGRPKLNQYLRGEIVRQAEEAGAPVIAIIRAGVAVRESNAMQVSLIAEQPASKPAQDYMTLYRAIMKGLADNGSTE